MKKVIRGLLFVFLYCILINNIYAMDVASDGSYTMFGKQYNINTGLYADINDSNIIEKMIYPGKNLVQHIQENDFCKNCKNQSVKEICYYYNADVDSGKDWDTNNTKILFVFDNDSAGVAWYSVVSNNNSARTGSLLNWKANGDKEWNTAKASLNSSDDASARYKKTGLCPDYLVKAEDGNTNSFYASTSSSASNLTHFQNLAEKEPGSKIETYYSVGDYDESKQTTLICDYGSLKISANEDGNFSGYDLPWGSKIENTGQSSNDNDLTVAFTYLSPKIRSSRYKAMFKKGRCPMQITACAVNHIQYWGSDIWGINYRDVVLYGDESFASGKCNASDLVYFQCNGDNCSDEAACLVYDDYKEVIDSDVSSYSSCGGDKNCQKKVLKSYNTHKDELEAYCLSYLRNNNYTEGGCVQSCLNYYDYLAETEISLGIRSKEDNYKCNIGSSIVNMVYNVLKWAKYIAPALIVILTMLDFIKAIASQNDDDIKKAQGKFVKRLIVAALLFLLPLIINFVLQTFGFYNESCDITNLF